MDNAQASASQPVLCLDKLASDFPNIPASVGDYYALATVIALDHNGHASQAPLRIEGMVEGRYPVTWNLVVSDASRRAWRNLFLAAEKGAEGIAILIAHLLGYTVVEQAIRDTGIDWWLGDEGDDLFQSKARLEVSGILQGETKDINARVKQKMEQTKQSDASDLPAYVIVVEFSGPRAKVVRR